MPKQQVIKQIILSWLNNPVPEVIFREKTLKFLKTKKIYTIIGPRRA